MKIYVLYQYDMLSYGENDGIVAYYETKESAEKHIFEVITGLQKAVRKHEKKETKIIKDDDNTFRLVYEKCIDSSYIILYTIEEVELQP